MKAIKAVALLIESSNAYARGLLDGIVAWQRENEFWSVYLPEQERGATPPAWLKNWRGNGIIARIETDEIANVVRRLGVPVVDVSAARHLEYVPWVETDDRAIAEMAIDHLLERGFRRVGFCGESYFNWSRWREQSFRKRAEQLGLELSVHDARSRLEKRYSWNREKRRLMSWLKTQPKPVGIMACYDIMGHQVLDACRELDIAVPERIAVIGVDNDERLCELCSPTLSSVVPDTRRTGYESAKLLHRMMTGEQVDATAHLIPPLRIADRRSTDALAIDDEDVVAALRFIRQHACDGIDVSAVLDQVAVSRRVLESRFLKYVGRSPHQEIERRRLDRVQLLLRQTDLSLQQVAHRAGYRDADYLCVAFKRATGMTPGAFRNA